VNVPEVLKHKNVAHSHGKGRRAACPASPHNDQVTASLACRSPQKLAHQFLPVLESTKHYKRGNAKQT